MMDWNPIITLINGSHRILLTTHENPDGDGLGCAAAMYHHFREQKKDCRVIIPSDTPNEYRFLDSDAFFERYDPGRHDSWLQGVELVVIFDVGEFKRLNTIGDAIQRFRLTTLNIDHHPYPEEPPFTYNLIDATAAATGEMIFDYLQQVRNGTLTKEICEGIYTAIMTDTGSFRYSNTNARCHEIAIECFRAGIDHTRIYQQVYESHSPSRMRLLGKILNRLHFDLQGELAWFTLTMSLLQEVGAVKEDVDGFTDIIRTIRGVEVAVMIFENENHQCRVNFRSKGRYTVNQIAKSLGGGGHQLAAGAVVPGNLDQVQPQVLEVTKQMLLEQQPGKA
jgi:phosphoesterase RecJ-like protein